MSKYKSLTEPITRREAALILDQKRFDGAIRSGRLEPVGKMNAEGKLVPADQAARTAPLLFNQAEVRRIAAEVAAVLSDDSKQFLADSKKIAKMKPPLTRRQIASLFGPKLTGILIRSGQITPDGAVTETATAAHTYDPKAVSDVAAQIAELRRAEGNLAKQGAKTRIPA